MRRRLALVVLLSLNALLAWDMRVSATEDGAAEIVTADGKMVRVLKERWQVGIDDGRTAEDGKTAGWLVTYGDDGATYAGELVIWRGGKIVRRFDAGPVFYSWGFYDRGAQVAFHTGPLHGEQQSHCELHDAATGRLIAKWDGDLEAGSGPRWTRVLDH